MRLACHSVAGTPAALGRAGASHEAAASGVVFFFSSRRRHTRLQGDWSSDVCSSDLFGLTPADLDTEFFTGSRTDAVPKRMKLRDILAQLQHIYAGNVGAEFAHMSDSEERLWLQDEFQQGRLEHRFSPEEQRNILWQLTAAEGLERYLHTKYIGQKRFSLEGADAFIPLLDDLIQGGGAAGIEEVVIGMAHRGRLNEIGRAHV